MEVDEILMNSVITASAEGRKWQMVGAASFDCLQMPSTIFHVLGPQCFASKEDGFIQASKESGILREALRFLSDFDRRRLQRTEP